MHLLGSLRSGLAEEFARENSLLAHFSYYAAARYSTEFLFLLRGFILARVLGPTLFGIWTQLKMALIFLQFSQLGAHEAMMREVTAIARTIASKAPLAIRGTKEMVLYTRDHSVAEGLNYIATWNAGMMSQADLKAGLEAQMSKSQATYED